jgi:hypothetical protein
MSFALMVFMEILGLRSAMFEIANLIEIVKRNPSQQNKLVRMISWENSAGILKE